MKLTRRKISRRWGFFLTVLAAAMLPVITSCKIVCQNRLIGLEMAAVRQINAIHSAQTLYRSQYGKYAVSLQELGPPTSGRYGPSAADLIAGDIATGGRHGYVFKLAGSPAGYTINATPVAFNETGRRTCFSDETQVIRENWGPEPAGAQSKVLE
jgi:hypothetical protein